MSGFVRQTTQSKGHKVAGSGKTMAKQAQPSPSRIKRNEEAEARDKQAD